MPQETRYTFPFVAPALYVRGLAAIAEIEALDEAGTVAVPTVTGSSFTLYDDSGTEIVSAQAITISNSRATYNVSAALLPSTLEFSAHWLELWRLVMPDGRTYDVQRSAALVRRRLYPVLTATRLERRHSELIGFRTRNGRTVQDYIREAWDDTVLRIIEDGRRPYLVLTPESYLRYHTALSLGYTMRDFATSASNDGKYAALAKDYLKEANDLWEHILISYDADQDGLPSSADAEQSGSTPAVWTSAPGAWYPSR